MKIDTSFLERCVNTLEKSFNLLKQTDPQKIDYDMYRSACRNSTAHDYGVGFAENTLKLLPEFIKDSRKIILTIQKNSDDKSS